MKKKIMISSVSVLCVFLAALASVGAAEKLLPLHNVVKDGILYAYVQNPGEYENVECQIGQDYASDVSTRPITDPELSVNTYILIDNSLSIQEKYRGMIKQVAKDIISSGKENELFTVAAFDTEIHYLIENSRDTGTLIQTVENIEFQNQETQVTNVLYHLCEKIEDEDENNYKRIVLMSDGVETKTIGYTREELIERLKKDTYPVYTLGCTYKSNETELENMFRISRETNAEYYFLDAVESADQVAAGIASSFDIVQVQARIPENQCDGASKGIKIVFSNEGGEKTVLFDQTMPLLARADSEKMTEDAAVTEDSAQSEETEAYSEGTENRPTELVSEKAESRQEEIVSENVSEKTTEPISERRLADQKNLMEIGALIAAVLLILGVVIAVLKKKSAGQESEPVEEEKEEKTEFLTGDSTEILGDKDAKEMDVINIRLTDIKRPAVVMEYPLESSVTIGRTAEKSQITFDYEKSVSGQHCEISRSGNKLYIQDLHSANRTFVNEKLVTEKMELIDGCIIKMGRLQVKFQNLDLEKPERENETGTKYMFDI